MLIDKEPAIRADEARTRQERCMDTPEIPVSPETPRTSRSWGRTAVIVGVSALALVGAATIGAIAAKSPIMEATGEVRSDVRSMSPPMRTANPGGRGGGGGGGGGPQTPPYGTFEVTAAEVIAGQQFSAGRYRLHAFGISCDEVMGDAGLFSRFLQLEDDEALPEPWRFLEGAVGAPKFSMGPEVGFRVQRISD